MVNPGTFHGLRKEFLLQEKATYRLAVTGGYKKDAVADIQRRFFKRFPIDLAPDEDPSAEHLALVDGTDPEPEPVAPNADVLTPDEYAAETSRLED